MGGRIFRWPHQSSAPARSRRRRLPEGRRSDYRGAWQVRLRCCEGSAPIGQIILLAVPASKEEKAMKWKAMASFVGAAIVLSGCSDNSSVSQGETMTTKRLPDLAEATIPSLAALKSLSPPSPTDPQEWGRAVSLKALQQDPEAGVSGQNLSDLVYLSGLRRIDAVILDEMSDDIIIAGSTQGPFPLRLDDLVVALRGV